MAYRKVRAGNEVTLRARFQDDLGDDAEASGVWIRIYPADTDTTNPDEAILSSADASYFDQGIFEYTYSVPHTGPDGVWYDQWYGTLNGQPLWAEFSFEVSASGIVEQFSNQLNYNNIVEVTISSGIQSTDGGVLEEDYTFQFLTVTTPSYTTVRKVRLDYGGYISDIIDETLQLGILEASLEADEITFETVRNSRVFEHARREWVTCKTAVGLLSNLGNQALRSKTLGDLSVTYDSSGLQHVMERAVACMEKWEPQVIAGGYAKAAQNPRGVVKGELDVDRPAVGRLWESSSTEPTPAANTKTKTIYERRYKSIFSKSKKRYW